MPRIVGNDLWIEEINRVLVKYQHTIHWRQAELEIFRELVEKQKRAGYKTVDIIKNFEQNYGIKQGAFYTRLRKAGYSAVI